MSSQIADMVEPVTGKRQDLQNSHSSRCWTLWSFWHRSMLSRNQISPVLPVCIKAWVGSVMISTIRYHQNTGSVKYETAVGPLCYGGLSPQKGFLKKHETFLLIATMNYY